MLPTKNATPKNTVPFACIKANDEYTYCGRIVYSGEFVFNDAEHAITVYGKDVSNTLNCCSDCVERYKNRNKKSSIVDSFSGAIRGMNDR